MSITIGGNSFERLVCGECGIEFYTPTHWTECRRDRGDHGGKFCCPNGHGRAWSEPAIDLIRRERDRLKQETARLEEEARMAWSTANAQVERAKKAEAEVKRVKKRATAALCPCCNRSFSNVAKHMATKHPDIATLGARPKAGAK